MNIGNLKICCFSCISTLFLLLTGCASNIAVMQQEPISESSVPKEVSLPGDDTPIGDSAEILLEPVPETDSPIKRAQELCSSGKFSEADSILRDYIQTQNQLSETESTDKSERIEQVIKIYSELMPADFPVPDEISALIFQQQLYSALDSINLSTGDVTSQIFNLSCMKETSFDIPVVWNSRVQQAIQFYLKNRKETINNWLSRSQRYLPFMRKMFSDNGLPQDLAYLPLIESGFNPKAYSRAHASGLWQFIPSTGKLYGMRNNYWLDERRDPLKATTGAVKYLKKLYGDFNNWHLALAAYNCGEGGVSRAMQRCNETDYWQLKLPKETTNYVPLYLAALTIAKNAECLGFSVKKIDTVFSYDTVHVHDCLDMKDIAQGIGISPDTLQLMNPHILHWCTPPDMTDIVLYLPNGFAPKFTEYYKSIPDSKKVRWYRYKIKSGDNIGSICKKFKIPAEPILSVNRMKNTRIVAGKYLFIPIPVNSPQTLAHIEPETHEEPVKKPQKVVPPSGQKITYQVKQGETLWGISELFNISPEDIAAWNELSSVSQIRAGQTLVLYPQPKRVEQSADVQLPQGKELYKVQIGDTPASIARKFGMSINELITLNKLDNVRPVIIADQSLIVNHTAQSDSKKPSPVTRAIQANPSMTRYRVSEGDNLYRISKNFNVSIEDIRAINGLSESSVLRVGDIIIIPETVTNRPPAPTNTPVKAISNEVVFYEVKQGDNLWRIANTFGIPVQNLYDINNLTSDSVIMPGDTIKVYRTGKM